ncbi:MAG: transcriptional repressor LexA [Chloroflexota bacterium]
MALSERQQAILQCIQTFLLENGYPPSIREIGESVGISSTSVVNYNLNALQRAGLIERDKTVSRGIKLVNKPEKKPDLTNLVSVPLLGHIAAGQPIDLPEGAYSDEFIDVPQALITDEKAYALKVKGTSMIDALINDGDIVIMKPALEATDGEMVAVWLESQDETTLKRFYNEGEQVRLQPENSTMDPIYVDPKDVRVQGKVMAVMRMM